jgi:DNA-binding MarR family transcriptional regulator
VSPSNSPLTTPAGNLPPSLPLVTAIQRATHVLGLHLETVLADLGLSQGEIHVLSLLALSSTLSVSDLQRGVRHRPSTLTGILDRLAAKQLVQRRINAADRRSNLIALTPAGRAAAGRVTDAMAAIERRLLQDHPPAHLAIFRQILGALAADLWPPSGSGS